MSWRRPQAMTVFAANILNTLLSHLIASGVVLLHVPALCLSQNEITKLRSSEVGSRRHLRWCVRAHITNVQRQHKVDIRRGCCETQQLETPLSSANELGCVLDPTGFSRGPLINSFEQKMLQFLGAYCSTLSIRCRRCCSKLAGRVPRQDKTH